MSNCANIYLMFEKEDVDHFSIKSVISQYFKLGEPNDFHATDRNCIIWVEISGRKVQFDVSCYVDNGYTLIELETCDRSIGGNIYDHDSIVVDRIFMGIFRVCMNVPVRTVAKNERMDPIYAKDGMLMSSIGIMSSTADELCKLDYIVYKLGNRIC